MADAKIVNIKGVQWDLKDEVARNKITNLEQKTQENTEIIKGLNKNIGAGFIAKRNVKNVIMYPFETCFISGFIGNVGAYMAILTSVNQSDLSISNLYGSVSSYMNVKNTGEFQFELTLDGTINLFGFAQGVS